MSSMTENLEAIKEVRVEVRRIVLDLQKTLSQGRRAWYYCDWSSLLAGVGAAIFCLVLGWKWWIVLLVSTKVLGGQFRPLMGDVVSNHPIGMEKC